MENCTEQAHQDRSGSKISRWTGTNIVRIGCVGKGRLGLSFYHCNKPIALVVELPVTVSVARMLLGSCAWRPDQVSALVRAASQRTSVVGDHRRAVIHVSADVQHAADTAIPNHIAAIIENVRTRVASFHG